MKRFVSIWLGLTASVALWAQTSIRVDVQNIVAQDEQFNVTFIIEGESRPSDFTWSPGDDFQLVWGPQSGSSTSISIVNGKRTRSSQYTYTYILSPKAVGKFSLPVATATVGGSVISSRPATVEVVSGGASASSRGSQSQAQGNPQSRQQTGTIADEDLFMRLTLSRNNVVIGEPVTATLKLYQRVDLAGFEDAKFPTFNGFWSQEVEAPTNINFSREVVGGEIYNSAVLRRWVLIPQQAGTLQIDPAELVVLANIRVASRSNSIFDSFFEDNVRQIRKRVIAAREIQNARFQGTKITCNARITPDKLAAFCPMTDSAKSRLKAVFEKMGLSARAYDRLLKVARTAADMAGSEVIEAVHIAEAVQYRTLDRKYWQTDKG